MSANFYRWTRILLNVASLGAPIASAWAQPCVYSPPEIQGDYYFGAECIANLPGRHYLRTEVGLVSSASNEVRQIIVRVPTNSPGTAMPLLLVLHGNRHNAASMEDSHTNLVVAAEEKGAVLAFLNGSEDPNGGGRIWHACGDRQGPALHLTYVEGVVLWLQHFLPIDTRRTFVSGFSGGAFMTQRVAADRPHRFRAAAAVCSSTGYFNTNLNEYCGIPTAAAPIPMLLLRGGQDVLVPPDGITPSENGLIWDSVAEQMNFWVTAAGGTINKVTSVQVNADTTRHTYASGSMLVEMFFDRSLGHQWPTAYDRPVLDWLLALPSDPAIRHEGNSVIITYPSGTLQSAGQVSGPWADVEGAQSPHMMPRSESRRFFRTRL